MDIPRVDSLTSPKSNRPVANQFVIRTNGFAYFQSYQTIIACVDDEGITTLDKNDWDYSRTTLKYLKEFLSINYSVSKIRKMIADGEYKVADLNKYYY
jgi:ABC-type Fe3+ transport system substrate-binding protein